MPHDPLLWILTLSVLGILPFLLLTLTCFTRITILLLFVRQGLGVGNLPPNIVLNSIALLLSVHIMLPVFLQMKDNAQSVLQEREGEWQLSDLELLPEIIHPWTEFLHKNSGVREIHASAEIRNTDADAPDLLTLALAFILTELQRALEAGVMILLPFLLIDLLVALVLLALGAHMLSPTSVSPPLKVLLFLSVEGWVLIAGGLARGYHVPALP